MKSTASGITTPVATPATSATVPASTRETSVDAFRGLVMFLMMAEVLKLSRVADAFPSSSLLAFLAHHQSHVTWVGCSLHDLIQPSFSFLVGVALPFSLASRKARGQTPGRMWLHAWWRALLLVLLGVFLRSMNSPITNWTFEDTLTQIGLGYGILFTLGFRPLRDQWIALGVVVVGYWLAFALYPLPSAGFDYGAVGVSDDWLKANGLAGFAAHWQKNSNLAWAFDTWFLNLFKRTSEFTANAGGYATLSFIPTLGTMILGLIAGEILKSPRSRMEKLRWFLGAGVIGLLAGWAIGAFGICPVVKRIWTPAWVFYSGGWCFLLLAAFYAILGPGWPRGWAFPLVVVGMNSIAAYLIAHLFEGFISTSLTTHLGQGFFKVFGDACYPLIHGAFVLGVLWLILFWMYRKKIFLRV